MKGGGPACPVRIFKMKPFVLILAASLSGATQGATLRYDVSTHSLWVQGGALNNSEIRRIETLLDVHQEIRTVHFLDIQGGNSLLAEWCSTKVCGHAWWKSMAGAPAPARSPRS